MEEVESCLDNSDVADMGDETTAAEADKENLSSSSPNISQPSASDSGASAGKRPPSSMLTVVNEKGGRGKAAGKAAAAGSSPAAMNSRGAMLLNLSRYVTTARREIRL
jgi:hypothetical protein